MSKQIDKLGIAIVGCGAIAQVNAEAIQRSRSARLAYAVDANPAAAEAFGQQFSIPFTHEIDKALTDKEVEAVFICTPHYLHAPLAEKAAAAGKHVIVEKPMGSNLSEAERIVAASARAGVKLSVCYPMRYWRNIQEARQFIQNGGLGRVIGIEIVMLRDRTESFLQRNTWQEINPNWHGIKAKSGGGMFIDNFSHFLDYFRYLTGLDAAWVFAGMETALIPADVEDMLIAVCGYENGALGNFLAGSSVRGGGREKNPRLVNSLQRIWGENGQVMLEPELRFFSLKRIGKCAPDRWQRRRRLLHNSTGAGLEERVRYIDMFAEAVLSGKDPEISGEDGLKVMGIIDAAYRSAESGRKIEISREKAQKAQNI